LKVFAKAAKGRQWHISPALISSKAAEILRWSIPPEG